MPQAYALLFKVFGVSFFFLSVIQLVKNDSEDMYNVCLELSIHERILGKNTMFFNKNINWHCLRRILIIIRNIC